MNGGVTFWLAAYVALLPFQIEPSPDLRLALADAALFAYLVWRVSRIKFVRGAWSVWPGNSLPVRAGSLRNRLEHWCSDWLRVPQ
jgi:hypothetical protein